MTQGYMVTGKTVQTSNRGGNRPHEGGGGGQPAPYVPTKVLGNDPLPDRMSVEKDSPFFYDLSGRSVGIRVDGKFRPQNDVREYCVSEGWIKVPVRKNGKLHKERGKLVLITLRGAIEPFWRSK